MGRLRRVQNLKAARMFKLIYHQIPVTKLNLTVNERNNIDIKCIRTSKNPAEDNIKPSLLVFRNSDESKEDYHIKQDDPLEMDGQSQTER